MLLVLAFGCWLLAVASASLIKLAKSASIGQVKAVGYKLFVQTFINFILGRNVTANE